MTDLGTLPGGDGSRAYGINENGQAVGGSYLASSEDIHAVLWEDGNIVDLGVLELGAKESQARGINESGHVVGVSQTASGNWHATLWTR